MGEADSEIKQLAGGSIDGIFSLSSTKGFWQSRRGKRASMNKSVQPRDEGMAAAIDETPVEEIRDENPVIQSTESTPPSSVLSEKRKALFEPLEPITDTNNLSRKRQSAESLLPPPDFDSTNYPKGWLVGKKRKLVNVDVVESMRRIAVQEMNRKDREIDGLSEQLDEDARCLEHLQVQLLEEKRKRSEVERENTMLHDQINMLMNMLGDSGENMEEEHDEEDYNQIHK